MNIRDKVSNEEIVGAERMVSATMVLHGTTNDDAVLAVVRYFWDRLLAPGQVAVDAADLRKVLLHTEIRGYPPAARLLPAVAESWSDAAADELKAALAAAEPAPTGETEHPEQPLAAWEKELGDPCPTCQGQIRETKGMVCQTCGTDYAAEPAPDTEQGETKRAAFQHKSFDDLLDERRAYEQSIKDTASGGGTEADGDEGEDPGSVQGRCPSCGGSSLFLGAGGYVTCSRSDCGEPDAATTLLEHTPAAEPQRDPETYPRQHRVLDELQGKMFAASQPVFDPEPQRVTLPDTISRSELVHALEDLINDGHVDSEVTTFASGLANKLDPDSSVIMDDLAEPPKADPAETAAPHGPTLAAVARSLRASGKYGYGVGVVAAEVADAFNDAADAIDREAGGDGQ